MASISYFDFNNEKNKRIFVNIADIGLGGSTVNYLQEKPGYLGGFYKYLRGALRTILTKRNKKMKLVVDKNKRLHKKLDSVIVANGRFFAGGMKIAPEASPVDDKLNIIVLNDFSRTELMFNLGKVYTGTHLNHPKVDKILGKEVTIKSEAKTYIDLDGEAIGKLPAKIKLLAQKLPVMVS